MNKSKQEVWQIIKQTLLGSRNPTKRQVCGIALTYAMILALLFFCALLHSGLAWIGVLWIVFMAQGIIIGLTDNSDRYVWQIVNQFLRRATKPTKGEKRFTVTAWIMLGITILLVIAFLISGFNSIFGWLVIGAIFGFIPLVIALYIWRVRDIIKQINPLRQQEKTT